MSIKKSQWLWAIPLVALTLLFALQGLVVADGQAIWQDVTESRIASRGTREIVPQSYRVVEANVDALQTALAAAPLEFSAEANSAPQTIALPLPDGTFEQFNVLYAPIMAPELAAKYPQIRTYRVIGIDTPAATGRIDFTVQGFHAFVISPDGTFFVDPYQSGDLVNYISYYKADYVAEDAGDFSENGLADTPIGRAIANSPTASQAITPTTTGPTRWTYDLLMFATGEFTEYHCGLGGAVCGTDLEKRATAQSAIVTGMNRVTGIYEVDLSVAFMLVARNDEFIYLDKTTDIFTVCCSDAGAMINAMQAHLNSGAAPTIAPTAYDIGHVVGASGGGGLAGPSPCGGTHNLQANGATARDEPINDPFWVDYTAHELGHQFYANHSYNASAGESCTTRAATAAYEPGGGTSIMGYAGICGGQNVQAQSDPMFNAGSLSEIVPFLQAEFETAEYYANTCATKTATGNTPPVVTNPANVTIPKDTPFALTGAATDAEQAAAALTYSWEQYDLGAAWSLENTLPNTDQGNGSVARPIFRTFLHANNPTRSFPQLASILDGTMQNKGEELPTIAQTMRFRLVVRDGQGGVSMGDTTVTIDPNQGPFLITSDNSRATWNYPGTETVTWDVNNTSGSCPTVNILISTNDGQSFLATPLVANTPNDGTETFTVPDWNSNQIRVKVACANNIFFDINNATITIAGATAVGLQSNEVSTPTTSGVLVLALTSLLVLGSAAAITVKRQS